MKKAGHGGKRSGAGRKPSLEGQKPKISVTLSKEAIANLDRQATANNVSRSELVEQYARGKPTAKAKQLLLYLESLPRTPETEEAMKMAVELIDSLPQLEE